MADKSMEVKNSKKLKSEYKWLEVDACLKKLEEMKKDKKEDEAILSYISETLEELLVFGGIFEI